MLPICKKYTVRGKSRVANIAWAWGKAECYICHKTLIKNCILSYEKKQQCFKCLTKFISLKFNTLSIHYFIEYANTYISMIKSVNTVTIL